MSRALSFVRLDMMTVKPYFTWKTILIILAATSVFSINASNGGMAVGMLMMYGGMMVTYPFAVGEKSDMDAFYTTLSIRRNTVVLGRYLFALISDLCAGVFAILFSLVAALLTIGEFEYAETAVAALIIFALYSVIQAIQLPLFFKLGYTKGKFIAYMPMVGFPLIAILFGNMFSRVISRETLAAMFGWFIANPILSGYIAFVLWLGIMLLSYRVSRGIYAKRDF